MNKKYWQVLGLSLALPSTILALGVGVIELIDRGYISKYVGISILVSVVGVTLYNIVKYARKN